MYGIYANIWGILMGSMLPYIAYLDPMGHDISVLFLWFINQLSYLGGGTRAPPCWNSSEEATGSDSDWTKYPANINSGNEEFSSYR